MLDRIGPWAFATITVVLGAVTTLAVLHVDTTVIFDVIMTLGIGYGGIALSQVRNNVNGNVEKLTALLEKNMDYLAQSPPVSTKDGAPDGSA